MLKLNDLFPLGMLIGVDQYPVPSPERVPWAMRLTGKAAVNAISVRLPPVIPGEITRCAILPGPSRFDVLDFIAHSRKQLDQTEYEAVAFVPDEMPPLESRDVVGLFSRFWWLRAAQ